VIDNMIKQKRKENDSIGVVETQYYTLRIGKLNLKAEYTGPITLAYETYGTLNRINRMRSWPACPLGDATRSVHSGQDDTGVG